MKAGFLLPALLLLGAAPAWQWHLPAGVTPPPVPADNPMSAAKVALGRRLFYDADLSLDGTMACATCHEQKRGFGDGNRTHPGVTGEAGRRNVPGLANVAWFAPLTHADSRQTTLERQVAVPVMGTHPVEMGMAGRGEEIAARLSRDACYRRLFAEAFPAHAGRIDYADVARALASFERTLLSYRSAYDQGRLDPAARAGQARFRQACAGCHAGVRFTDLAYHRLEPGGPADQGLYEVTGREADRGRFRTPSLRNVAMTGPWWHDGSAQSLEAAIARHGLTPTPALVAFLHALDDPAFATDPALRLPDSACGKPL